MTRVPAGSEFTQLFVNGKRQIRARYPNYDPSDPGKSGYIHAAGPIPAGTANPYAGPDEDMTFSTQAPRGIRFDPATFTKQKWANPEDAEIHIFQAAYWGNLQWKIKGHRLCHEFDLVWRWRSADRRQVEPWSCGS